jgi:uncharacterized surface anchored protein
MFSKCPVCLDIIVIINTDYQWNKHIFQTTLGYFEEIDRMRVCKKREERDMIKRKRQLLTAWMMALTMIINGFLPFNVAHAAEVGTSVLTNLTATVKQDGATIPENGTITSDKSIRVDISFGVPVKGDDPTPKAPVQKGDTVKFDLSSAFKVSSSDPIPLMMGKLPVGHASFATDPNTKMVTATVTFDGDDSVFNGDSNTVTCQFGADFDYNSDGENGTTGNHTITVLQKTYTVNVPAPAIQYSVTKSGTADLATQSIMWTVNVSAVQGGVPVDLSGYQFSDDLSAVGTYIDGSFQVGGSSTTPTAVPNESSGKLSYTFPAVSASPKQITFQTKIPDSKYYASGAQTINNSAQLLDSQNTEVAKGQGSVTFTPVWITKAGKSSEEGSTGNYNPKNRTITWTITANQMGTTLNNAFITDLLPSGLTLESAQCQTWDAASSKWSDTPIKTWTEAPADGKYEIGNISSQILLTIVTKVPDDTSTTGIKTYSNSAKINWDNEPGSGIGTGNVNVGIGYNAITKTGTADPAHQKIDWTVNVDTKGQNIPDLKVYDLLVYGKSVDLSSVTGIPDGIKSADLTPQYGQKYAGNYSGGTTAVNVIPVEKDGVRVADLLEITGLSTTAPNTFTFDSQVVDPDLFAGNKTSAVWNTATLFSAATKLNATTGHVNYPSKMLLKGLLEREAMSDPAAGVNSGLTNDAQAGFDYKDKSAIFRLNVNADGLDLTNMQNTEGQTLGKATLTDTLPDGWEFTEISPGQNYLIFEGTGQADGNVLATGTTPDTVSGLTADFTGKTAAFTFPALNKPYVILVKAKLTSETAAEYFDSNKTTIASNTATLKTEHWNPGVNSRQDVTIKSQILGKDTKQPQTGELLWTVNYNPYALAQSGTELTDTLPIGIDLRTDSHGNLLIPGNITANEMTLKADGTYTVGTSVALELGKNVNYDNATRVLNFKIPDSTKAYCFSYITDITGEPGSITNKVSLFGNSQQQEGTSKSYSISTQDGTASLKRNGWISIKKIDETGIPLSGAEFTLYATDGSTIIKKGVTGSDGIVKLKVIPDGEYILLETKAPEGYTLDGRIHSMKVTTTGSTVVSSIDGRTGTDANAITVKNYKAGTVGSLTIRKTVAGTGADTTKKFNFTVALTGAPGAYHYTGNGVPDGTIQSGGTISLAHGQSITIVGLPKESTYQVTEADYSGDGYITTSTGAAGSIAADTAETASFTNTRNTSYPVPGTGNLTIRKTVTGTGADTTKKFNFTVALTGAPGAYHYTGNGVPDGTIQSGGTISLAHGQSITIVGLPKESTYQVTEADYSRDGYTTTSTGAAGSIAADTAKTASFTNCHSNTPSSPGTPGNPAVNTGNGDIPRGSAGLQGNKGKNSMPQTGDNQAGDLAKIGLLFFSVALTALIAADFALRKKYPSHRNQK